MRTTIHLFMDLSGAEYFQLGVRMSAGTSPLYVEQALNPSSRHVLSPHQLLSPVQRMETFETEAATQGVAQRPALICVSSLSQVCSCWKMLCGEVGRILKVRLQH